MINNQGKIISIVIAVVIGAGIVFFGLKQFTQWHEEQVQTAVEAQKEKAAQQTVALIEQLERMEKELEENEPADIPEKRITEVFGGQAEDPVALASGEVNCAQLQQKIVSFFEYLDEQGTYNLPDSDRSGGSYTLFHQMIGDLAENPPIVVGETRDIISLLHNQAHFFRTLNKDRLKLVLNILKTEKDILEPTLGVFYRYYTSDECGTLRHGAPLDLKVLYRYAGFFLNTLSGKSYIMRRDSALGSLTRYYSVLILDKANEKGINEYGIDVRPHIELVLEDVRNQQNLQYRSQYVDKLERLSEKYRIRPAAQTGEADSG